MVQYSRSKSIPGCPSLIIPAVLIIKEHYDPAITGKTRLNRRVEILRVMESKLVNEFS